MQRRYKSAAALVLAFPLFSQPIAAQQNSSDVTFFVGAKFVSDTNLFRVEDEIQIPAFTEGSGLEDVYFVANAGIDSTFVLTSKSRIRFDAEILESIYDEYPEVDNTSGNLLARYDFTGNALEFNVGYLRVEELVNFENQLTPRIDFRVRQRVFSALRANLSPRWSIGGEVAYTDIDFDLARPVDRNSASFDITYESRKGSKFGIVAHYEERESQGANDLGFEEFKAGTEIEWKATADLGIDFDLYYHERDPVDPLLTKFDGPTGEIELEWQVSNGVRFSLEAFRRISSLGDQLSNFAIVDGQSFKGEWRTGEKLGFTLGLNHELRDFEDEPNLIPIPGQEVREDDLVYVLAGIEWKPRRSITIDASVKIGDRSSNRALQDFEYETYSIGIRYEFL